MASSIYGIRCGFCGRPNFPSHELLEEHVDTCAHVRGYIARFGTGIDAIGQWFECDPISGFVTPRPRPKCQWSETDFRSPQEAAQHQQYCAVQRDSSQPYPNGTSHVTVTQPATGDVYMREPRKPDNTTNVQTGPHGGWTQYHGMQSNGPVLASHPEEVTRSPYFYSDADERNLLDQINEPPSQSVISLLVDIARNQPDARAIPEAPMRARLLPIMMVDRRSYAPVTFPRLQPKPPPAVANAMAQPTAVVPVMKAKQPTHKRFIFCEGCERYCKHYGGREDEDVIYDT